jgi:hypothetical protein
VSESESEQKYENKYERYPFVSDPFSSLVAGSLTRGNRTRSLRRGEAVVLIFTLRLFWRRHVGPSHLPRTPSCSLESPHQLIPSRTPSKRDTAAAAAHGPSVTTVVKPLQTTPHLRRRTGWPAPCTWPRSASATTALRMHSWRSSSCSPMARFPKASPLGMWSTRSTPR